LSSKKEARGFFWEKDLDRGGAIVIFRHPSILVARQSPPRAIVGTFCPTTGLRLGEKAAGGRATRLVTEEMGLMRIKRVWGAGVRAGRAALTMLAPGRILAQESWPQGGFATGYAPPAVPLPYPLYSTHPEIGGLYLAGSYIMYNQTNPLRGQVQEVAVR